MHEVDVESGGPRRSPIVTGNLRKAVFILALPVLCEQFLNFCVGFVDTYLSGRLSSEATTAVGLGAYVGWLAGMMFGLVGTGTAALVSRAWGAGEFDEANGVANRSVALSIVMGLVVYAVVFILAPALTYLLALDGKTAGLVVRYLRLDALGYLFMSISYIGAAALRGAGNMRAPMFILGLVSVLNVVISSALVYGVGPLPGLGMDWILVRPLGIDGIVAGTVAARASGGLLMLLALVRGISGLRLVAKEMKIRGRTVQRILRIGGPAALDGAITWSGQFLFLMIIAHLDTGGRTSATFAAHMIGIRVEAITYLPAVAWGVAAATMIGQSLGAEDPLRARHAGNEAARQCSLLALLIATVFFVFAPEIYRLMHDDPAVWEIGIPAFRLLAFFQVPLVLSIVYVFGLRGSGDTRSPLVFNVVGIMTFRVPVAYLCGIILDGGLIGAWIGMCGDIGFRALLAAFWFLRGRWMRLKV